jgi:hypothetical protein
VTPGRTRSCRTCRCTLPGSTRSRSTSLSFGASSWSPPTSPTWTPSREDPGLRRPVQHRRGPVRLAIHPRRPEQPAPPHRRQGQRPRGSGSRMNGMMRTARLHQDRLGQRLAARARDRWPALTDVFVRFRGQLPTSPASSTAARHSRSAGSATADQPAAGASRSTGPATTTTKTASCPPGTSPAAPKKPSTAPADLTSPTPQPRSPADHRCTNGRDHQAVASQGRHLAEFDARSRQGELLVAPAEVHASLQERHVIGLTHPRVGYHKLICIISLILRSQSVGRLASQAQQLHN